jgi:hypothetical protein
MSMLTKSNHSETQPMVASPVPCQKYKVRPVSVITPYLRHLNTGTLAFVMFVALAVLSPIRGKDAEKTGSTPANQGYLQVYSATDEFDDGGVPYHTHSPYAIYTIEGKLFKNVENHISRSDEIPEVVTLPVGSYVVEARSESRGYVRVPVVITAERQTVLDPDKGQTDVGTRLTRTKRASRLASR